MLDHILSIPVPVVLFLLFVLTSVFIGVMTVNYRLLRREVLKPTILPNEHFLDKLDVVTWFTTNRMVLTNRRVFQLKISWFFSRRKLRVIDLEDANSVIWKGHTNWWLIGLSIIIFLSGLAMPLAFVLFLLGVENRVNGLRIRGDLNRMPWGRFSASTMRHHTCNEIWRFYRNVAMVWSERRALGTGDDAFAKLTPPEREDGRMDFRWGATAWAAVLALMVLALVQRVWFDNVGFSNVVFGALYLAIPLALALRRFSDGLKVAVLAVPALLTVKFPSLGWKLLPPEATQALMADYILVWIAMIVIAAAGFAISMFLNRKYALLAVALWLPFVALYLPATVLNLSIVIQVVLSALFTVLISILAGSVGSTAAATGGLREAD